MTVGEAKKNLKNLERNMYGYNYEAHFGLNVLDGYKSIDEIRKELSLKYSDARFCDIIPELASELDLWNSIRYGLEYRGDDVAGLKLSNEKEKELLIEQEKYKLFIQQYLTDSTVIFNYPAESGIPYVSILWGYSFILFNSNGTSLFINGLASD
ncbi:hypothetical protein ACFST9_00640 [Hymenobacter monticola]|uniref:Uncharacterized protein n=1 Tax=Hymenobacter monticola TaxID=1705399 RepID=A0ABY4B306_9BACT|nr:hypothetical protein [Hymenobacter monticola]UOE33529.1 hypothetical protein MTP16_20695 [Hymenobacter monticola]